MSKLAKYLIFDLQNDWSKPSIKFFRSNGAYGFIIWLHIVDCYFSEKNTTIDEIVLKVDRFASRRTVLDFINKGVDALFLKKVPEPNDKRKIKITPTDVTIEEYKIWSAEFIKSVT